MWYKPCMCFEMQIGMPKFGPEPQFEPWTFEPNLRFRFSPVLVLPPVCRLGSRFFNSFMDMNLVRTRLNQEPTRQQPGRNWRMKTAEMGSRCTTASVWSKWDLWETAEMWSRCATASVCRNGVTGSNDREKGPR